MMGKCDTCGCSPCRCGGPEIDNKQKVYEADPFIELLGIFKRIECDDECDYCTDPQNGSYIRPSGVYEYPDEVDYSICGKCIVENQKRNKGRFIEYDLSEIILPF